VNVCGCLACKHYRQEKLPNTKSLLETKYPFYCLSLFILSFASIIPKKLIIAAEKT